MPAETHVSHSPLQPDDLVEIVCRQVSDVFALDVDAVSLDADLRADLGADDLALIDLVEAIEAELGDRTVGFSFADDALGELRTVGDIVEYVLACHSGRDA